MHAALFSQSQDTHLFGLKKLPSNRILHSPTRMERHCSLISKLYSMVSMLDFMNAFTSNPHSLFQASSQFVFSTHFNCLYFKALRYNHCGARKETLPHTTLRQAQAWI